MDGVNFGAWLYPGDSLLTVDWSIGTAAFGADIGTNTANSFTLLSSSGPNTFGYTLAEEGFSFAGIDLTAGRRII